jgi:ubiquinone/menaquinone biosynthesis C-methylase UbiE
MFDRLLQLDEYKQAIAESYNLRSESYDRSDWHMQICRQLLAYSQISHGQHILDIGTGTGHLAIAAAQLVGASGRVIGIDISEGMLEQAKSKVAALGLNNIEFQLADAEKLSYPNDSFHRILCANTFPWLEAKAATLQLWHRLLKPGGKLGIHTPADTAYTGAVILKQVLAKYGIYLEPSNRIGSSQLCVDLLQAAGFESIAIQTEQHGSYTTLDRLKTTWENIVVNPSPLSLKDPANRLSQLTFAQLRSAQAEFTAELELLQIVGGAARNEHLGIWDDLTTLYLVGNKSE